MAGYASTEVNEEGISGLGSVRRFSRRPTRVSELTQGARRFLGVQHESLLESNTSPPPGLGELGANQSDDFEWRIICIGLRGLR
jgi:hypothetical protein